jgi:hypothetical protein
LTAWDKEYLDQSLRKSATLFVTVSGLKAVLDIIEGSDIEATPLGVGVDVEVGDVVQPLYDLVDIAWHACFWGMLTLTLMRVLLAAAPLAAPWALGGALLAGLLAAMAAWLLPRRRLWWQMPRDLAFLFAMLALSLYLLLPAAVAGAAWLSRRITGPMLDEVTRELAVDEREARQLKDLLAQAERAIRPEPAAAEGFWERLNVKRQMERAMASLNVMMRDAVERVKQRTHELTYKALRLVAAYVFDCLVFPLAVFFGLYAAGKRALAYLFGLRRDQAFREGLAALLARPAAERAEESASGLGER